jgi:tetratricopeptide (TPR) repeat protein
VTVPNPEKKEPEEQPEGQPEGKGPGEGQAPGPEAAETITPEAMQMAEGCFQRAAEATVRGNFDYAIHLFMEGFRYNPRDVEKGHKGLRELALKRRSAGKGFSLGSFFGQAKGMLSQTLGRTKDAFMGLLDPLARDPQNVNLLMQIMQTARRLGYLDVAIYYGEVAAEETLRTKRPQKQVFTTLADMYEAQNQYQKAVDALSQATKIDPADRTLDRRARNLAAQASIDEGKLESISDFRDMIRDRRQASLSATQQVIRTEEQLEAQYEELKAALEADPKNPHKIQALADCQARRGHVGEAMALLQAAFDETKEYRFKMRMDDIRMSETRRSLRDLNEQLDAAAGRADLKAKRQEIVARRDASELDIFTERQRQYPTEMGIRYELGVRQYRLAKYDDAIVSFQQATRDPKRRIQALNMLGRCFFNKQLLQEAQGQFETAIQQYELKGDPLAKELQYNLAMTFEAQEKYPQAVEWYSVIVQQDYQYRDAAKRLEALRKKVTESQGKT